MNAYMNPYLNPYYLPQTQPTPQVQNNVLPFQQILQANGKQSIDALQMSPNSSALIADTTAPVVWKCVSDSLGNVTATPFDITEHKDETVKVQESLVVIVSNIDERLKKVEEEYESIIKSNEQHGSVKADVGNVQKHGKPTSNDKPNNGEQKSTIQETK